MHRITKRVATTVGAAVAALATSVAFGTSAEAAGNTVYSVTNPTGDAKAQFVSNGDDFILFDLNQKDAYGVVLDVQVKYGSNPYQHFTNKYYSGAGYGWLPYSYDFVEGRLIRFRVCLQKGVGAKWESCSGWRTATA
ncbi:hypothetical protein [Embleya hyalina]|uniref:Secreted protein n=1 Tax=Embleya hyalina TaxID=516124 RepID=A0A401Z1R4_9ACTN|nr:hypothetical protein [Embleya hyalina]GCE00825.1 hypothetical protein EHYA_08551 [Embleya hyalina]